MCRKWDWPRSNFYAQRQRQQAEEPREPRRSGPRPKFSDRELAKEIRKVLEDSPFVGEGYRKAWARLRAKDIRVAARRVLRVMREAGLQASTRAGHARGPKAHDATITTERGDEMWGIEATSCLLTSGFNATIFVAVNHGSNDCVGIHAARPVTRFEALEPLRQAIPASFGSYEEGLAQGLALRHDHGSQFISDDFQEELDFLGIESIACSMRLRLLA